MSDPYLIAFTGAKRSGKDTAAAALLAQPRTARVAFADPLRRILAELDPFLDDTSHAGQTRAVSEYDRLMRAVFTSFETHAHVTPTMPQARATLAALAPSTRGTVRLSDLLRTSSFDQLKDETNPHHREIRRLLQVLGTEGARDVYDTGIWVREGMRRVKTLRGAGTNVVITDCRFDDEAEAVNEAGGYVVRITRKGLPTSDRHPSEAGISHRLVTATLTNDGSIQDLAEDILDFASVL